MTDNPEVETADKFYFTEEPELVKPTEEPVSTEIQEPEKTEDPEKSEELEAKDEEETAQYVEIDGEEHNLEDVRTWRDGHLMQSDYTKKTQAVAEERKAAEVEFKSTRENLLKSKAEVSDMRDMLTVLVQEDEAVDWVELKEDDPEKYIELKEKADKRKEALEKVKAERETPVDDPALIQVEQGKLFEANPEWLDKEGKATDSYKQDTELMNDYASKAGFTTDEFSQMTRAHYIITILKAAKYDQLQEKGKEISKKRGKVPVVTKPKAPKPTVESRPMHETFYGKTAAN